MSFLDGIKQKLTGLDRQTVFKKIFSYTWQGVVLLLIIYGISKWQARDLLPSETAAPEFELQALSGKTFSLSDQKGKSVVLYFFAPWCTVCKASFHNLKDLRDAREDREVMVFAVGLGYSNIGEIEQFAKDRDPNVPVLLGTEKTARDYLVSAFPTVYFIDSQGNVADKVIGYTTELGMRLRVP